MTILWYLERTPNATRGVTQGDAVSPVIFNIMVDSVLNTFYHIISQQLSQEQISQLNIIFYADDGKLAGPIPQHLQQSLNIISDLFKRLGLLMNASKSFAMICKGRTITHTLSDDAYARMTTGIGPDYRTRQRKRIFCPHCQQYIQHAHILNHYQTQHPHQHQLNITA